MKMEKKANSSAVQCLPSLHKVLDLVLSNKTYKYNTTRNIISIKEMVGSEGKRNLLYLYYLVTERS